MKSVHHKILVLCQSGIPKADLKAKQSKPALVGHRGHISSLNRVTVEGSFSLNPSRVDRERGRITVGDVFRKTKKAVQWSYSADAHCHLKCNNTT